MLEIENTTKRSLNGLGIDKNKNAAITVMRPTRSFSLWEMTKQIYEPFDKM